MKELLAYSGEYEGKLIESILSNKSIKICDHLDPNHGSVSQLSSRLKQIKRQADFITEERGTKDLYIGWPYVEGLAKKDSPIRAPLIFFPVELQLEGNQWELKPRSESAINFNKSLLLAYSFHNKVSLPDDLVELDLKDLDRDLTSFISGLFQQLKNSPFQIHFGSKLFEQNHGQFHPIKKKDFEKSFQPGEYDTKDYGVLGIFPQSGSFLVPDYEKLIEGEEFQDLEDLFASKRLPEQQDSWQTGSHYRRAFLNRVKEEEVLNPLAIDSSQENALKAIKKGHSIVVQGPPGSGKSQLITNLICDNIAKGKKVLLVSQKRVALDVVFQRLSELGLEKFAARVSDFKNDRAKIFSKISDQIDSIPEYEQSNSGIDTIFLERNFLQASKAIDQIEEELNEYKEALFNTEDCGISPKELYLSSNPNLNYLDTGELFSFFRLNELDGVQKNFKSYSEYHRRFQDGKYSWKERKSFANYSAKDQQAIHKILEEIPVFQSSVNEEVRDFLLMGISYDEHKALVDHKKQITQFIRLIEQDHIHQLFIEQQSKPQDKTWLETRKQIILDFFIAPGPEVSISRTDLDRAFFQVSKAIKRRKNPFYKLFSAFGFNKDPELSDWLKTNKLQDNLSGLSNLERKISNRMNLEHNLSILRKASINTSQLPKELLRDQYLKWFEDQGNAIKAVEIFNSFRSLANFFDPQKMSRDELVQKINGLVELSERTLEKVENWGEYLNLNQIFSILANNTLASELEKDLRSDFPDLVQFDKLSESLSKNHKSLFDLFLQETVQNDPWKTLKNSLYLDWIEHLEEKYPILSLVSSKLMEQKIEELQRSLRKKNELTRELVLLRTRERTFKDLEYNRLNNRITYRELGHQVNKKRKIWPLRKVIAEFHNELFALVPCWMASPESVSAMFPLEQIFDLILFDEASQCFSEKGIPALYRGKQVGVFGDKNQLSPFDLYQARYEDPEEEGIDLEAESLLDLSANYLMEIPLTEHYRSKSIELIGFSNKHFYKGQLSTVPEFQTYKSKERSMEYHQILNGVWESNKNEIEAREVVNRCFELIKEEESSIGIITFNFQQQQLIQDLLEIKFQEEGLSIPSELFVKNLENVQGDEREVIIFSPAYAPGPDGKFQLKFGSLNALHGERRLNVAITRARSKVIVFSSLNPDLISTDHLQNLGPKLFFEYLGYCRDISKSKKKMIWEINPAKEETIFLKDGLIKRVKKEGTKVNDSIPFADFIVGDSEEGAIAVRTDDQDYFRASSSKSFFAYGPFEMERKNWPITFSHSRNYWLDPEKETESIFHFLNWKKS